MIEIVEEAKEEEGRQLKKIAQKRSERRGERERERERQRDRDRERERERETEREREQCTTKFIGVARRAHFANGIEECARWVQQELLDFEKVRIYSPLNIY